MRTDDGNAQPMQPPLPGTESSPSAATEQSPEPAETGEPAPADAVGPEGTAGSAGAPAEPAAAPRTQPATGLPSMDALGPRFAEFVAGLESPVVFFDTETTGTDPAADRIIEISLVRVSPMPVGIEPPRTWRINPQARIPVEASRIHGITNEDVAEAPTFGEVAREILDFIHGCHLAGFNMCRFDLRILQCELMRVGLELDLSTISLIDAQVIFHKREPRTLAAALQFYRDRELHDAHGAEADTIATLEVFAGQLERYGDLSTDIQSLHQLSSANNEAYCDLGRRFVWKDDEPVFNFGKLRGKSLRWVAADPDSRSYLRWMIDGSFEEDTKAIVREALDGHIRRRPAPEDRKPTPPD